jgi:hypothetical protein
MNRYFSALIALAAILSFGSASAQPWTYNFGTTTGTFNTSNTASTTFLNGLTATPSGGGIYRVRVSNAQGGSFNVDNPGTSLGTDGELRIVAPTGTSLGKFGVYDWTSPSIVAYTKFKMRSTSSANGTFTYALGINTIVSDNQSYSSHYNNSVAMFQFIYAAGNLTTVNRRISGSWTAVTGSGLAKDTDQEIEIYANNGASSTVYNRSGTDYTLNSQTWDLWVGGTKISPAGGWAKAGTGAAGINLSGFCFWSESSTGNVANLYLDDLEYSNAFPACTAPSTNASDITFSAVTTTSFDVTWTNGNGGGRVVKMNTSNSFTAPADGSNPTANTTWQNAGEQVVFNGSGSGPITISGLTQNTTYHFRVFEYCTPNRNYQAAFTTGNPNSQTTATGPGLSSGVLTAFGAQCTGSTYGPNMFTITGSNLTTANITVTAPFAQYQFATDAGGPYTASLNLVQGGGSYSQDVYVQFTPNVVSTYNGNIVVGGGGAPNLNVPVSGSGIASAAPTLSNFVTANITSSSVDLSADIPSVNCSDVTARGFEWSLTNGFANGSGTPVSETGTFGTGTYTLNVTGLPSNTTIYWKAYATNGTGTTYSAQQSFTTAQFFLSVGDISVIAINSNTPDNFAFVNWVDLPNNIVIKFTDGGFNAAVSATAALNARGTEGFVIWRNNTGNTIPAGTVIQVQGATTTLGLATDASPSGTGLDGISGGGDQIFAYQGAATAGNNPDYSGTGGTVTLTGNVLFGLHMQGSGPATWLSTGAAGSNDSYLPTELNVANGNIVIGSNAVGAQYNGTRSALGSIIAYRDLVNNPANWTTVTGTGTVAINTTAFSINPNVATQVAVTAINGGVNPSTNTGFPVSIEVRDASNNPAAVGQNTTFQVTLLTGTGAIGGTFTGVMTAGSGSIDITGVTYNVAEAGVSVQVSVLSGQSLTAGNSATFTVDPAATQLAFSNLGDFVYTLNNVPTFVVQAQRPDNSLDVNYSGTATISLISGTGTLLGTLSQPMTAGEAFFNDISFDEAGIKEINVNSGVLATGLSGNITVSTATITEVILPEFIEGKQPTNTNRLPYVYRVTLGGLKPNSTFRYNNGMVLGTDAATSNGAGNAIFVEGSNFTRSATQSLSTAGNYGEFTTDGTGTYTGWFITEPTGNATRFNPGADIYPRIILNNGANGTAPAVRLTTTNSVRVIEMGATAAMGTALRGNSNATAKNFLFVYNNTIGSGRPISGSFIESDGTLNTTANSYSAFYETNVDGVAGAYGMIIPNNLSAGIRRIETRDLFSGELAGCSSTDANGIWPSGANTVNPTGGATTPIVITISDAPLAPSPETCDNYIDDDCDGFIDESCPGNFANDAPDGAIIVSFSPNNTYPNCYAISGDNTIANNSAESAAFDGPDSWYRFVAQSTGVSITLSSSSMDDAIALYSRDGLVYSLLDSEDASTGASDFERLNYNGLTPGLTYYVSVGASSGAVGGPFALCIQHLMPSGCASVQPVGGFNLCNSYKAIFRGAAGSGVTYDFNFTGVGGGASGTTSLNGTNGLIALSNPTLALRYGGVYDVQVNVNYSLLPSTGGAELISIPGSIASANCSGVTMRTQPMVEVRSSQRCPASLLRSNFLIGNAVTGDPLACGVINYTYSFTQVVSCADGTTAAPAVEYTTAGANPFLPLGVLPNLANSGAWDVQIRPNFSYGPGVYGPVQRISVANTAAMTELSETEMTDDMDRSEEVLSTASLYPNPNDGVMMNINLTDLSEGDVWVRITDSFGRMVYQQRYVAQESLNTVVVFDQQLASGIYVVEFRNADLVMTEKMVVSK